MRVCLSSLFQVFLFARRGNVYCVVSISKSRCITCQSGLYFTSPINYHWPILFPFIHFSSNILIFFSKTCETLHMCTGRTLVLTHLPLPHAYIHDKHLNNTRQDEAHTSLSLLTCFFRQIQRALYVRQVFRPSLLIIFLLGRRISNTSG